MDYVTELNTVLQQSEIIQCPHCLIVNVYHTVLCLRNLVPINFSIIRQLIHSSTSSALFSTTYSMWVDVIKLTLLKISRYLYVNIFIDESSRHKHEQTLLFSKYLLTPVMQIPSRNSSSRSRD